MNLRLPCLCYIYSFTKSSSEHKEGLKLVKNAHLKCWSKCIGGGYLKCCAKKKSEMEECSD